MTIYDIEALTRDTAPHFFDPKTLKFFGQKLASFSVKKQPDGRFKISAPSYWRIDGVKKLMGATIRFFNPENNKLEDE